MTNNSRVLNTKKNLIPKLDVEKKNKDYKLKNKNIDSKKISQIEIRKKDNLIEISKNDEVILKTKIEQEVLEKIEYYVKNNYKFELKIEDLNEKNIKQELNKIIAADKNEVNKISDELDKIETVTPLNKSNEYIKKLEERIKKIKDRLGIIKNHYEVISNYYDFKGYDNLNNILLINSIEDYKFYKTDNEIDELVLHCHEECKKLDVIIDATDKCIKTDKKILEIKKYNEKRDKDYLNDKEKISLIDACYEKINKNMENEKNFLNKLDEDIIYINNRLDSNLFYNSKTLLDNILNISICTNLMPIFPSFTLLLQTIILKNLTDATRILFNANIKKEIITKNIISKYLRMISENEENMDLIVKYLNDNITNVKEIKKEFVKKFEQHKDALNDYDKYLNKIDLALKNLEEKNKKIEEYKKNLSVKKDKILELKNI